MSLNEKVWMPHFKFMMQTIAVTYPTHPNDVSKKKYYDFIQNLPVFIPMKPLGDDFIKMLDDFPVTSYLDSRKSFMKWVHFINNKLNKKMNLPEEDFHDSLEKYYNEYKPKDIQMKEIYKSREKYIKVGLFASLLLIIYYFYNRD